MKLYKSIEIPEDNPFINDKFHREDLIDSLMSILRTYDSGLVLSIDSSWGTGKTTFIKMWEAHLKNNAEFKPIYFNAWENDDSVDPLVPLISLLSNELSNENGIKFKDTKLCKIGTKILKKGVPFALKVASHGLLDLPEISLNGNAEKQIEDFSGKIGETIFDDYKEKTNLKKQFKSALLEYQHSINKKIVIFIDELDRCRPLYAIETLERIKHFFDLDNFIFILSMDKSQLSHSVSTIYGSNMDSVGYLRRFIDIELMLPEPDFDAYFEFLILQYQLEFDNTEYFWCVLKTLSKLKKISLRDIDKLFANIRVLLPQIDIFNIEKAYTEIYIHAICDIYSYLLILKITDPENFKKFLYKQNSQNEVQEFYGMKDDIMKIKINYIFYDENNMTLYFKNTIRMFLELNSYNLKENSVYSEICHQRDAYTIGNIEGFGRTNSYNLIKLWSESDRKCEIIDNLTFINSVKIDIN